MTPRPLLAALAFAALTACGGPTSDPPPEGLAVTIEPQAVIAGSNSVLVTVTGNIQYPLHLSTTVGYWASSPGSTIITLDNINSAYLTSCSYSVTTPWCAGVATVYASDAKQSGGRGYVSFYP